MASTSTHQVQGPYKIEVASGASGGPTWLELGVASNDDLFAFSYPPLYNELTSVESGDEPEDHVYIGGVGNMSFTLSRWLEAQKATLIQRAHTTASAQGAAGAVGSRLGNDGSSGVYYFSLRLTSIVAGVDTVSATKPGYTFHKCFIPSGQQGITPMNFGNQSTALQCQFAFIRNSSGVAYIYETSRA